MLETGRTSAEARCCAISERITAVSRPALAPVDDHIKALRRELHNLPALVPGSISPTNGYHSAIHAGPDATAWVQLDLGDVLAIDEIRLRPARPVDFPDTPGFGFPVRFHVEVSHDPTFAEGIVSLTGPVRMPVASRTSPSSSGRRAGRRGLSGSRRVGCGNASMIMCLRWARSKSSRTA